jgi:hypothetical protein
MPVRSSGISTSICFVYAGEDPRDFSGVMRFLSAPNRENKN